MPFTGAAHRFGKNMHFDGLLAAVSLRRPSHTYE